MQTVPTEIRPTPLPLRTETILGVCEAIGEDFGFNPNWLRLLFAATFYFNPLAVVGSYLALGLLVAASRWFAPKQAAATVTHEHVVDAEPLAIAA